MKRIAALVLAMSFVSFAAAQNVNFDQGVDIGKIVDSLNHNDYGYKYYLPLLNKVCKAEYKNFDFNIIRRVQFDIKSLPPKEIKEEVLNSSSVIMKEYKNRSSDFITFAGEYKTNLRFKAVVIPIGSTFILYRKFFGDFGQRENTLLYDDKGKVLRQTANGESLDFINKEVTCRGCTGLNPPFDPGDYLSSTPVVDGKCYAKQYAACVATCVGVAPAAAGKCLAACAVSSAILCTHSEKACIVCPYDLPGPQP